jgi:putative tricarboxylic transport membrane protein
MVFLNSKLWVRSLFGLVLGCFVGLIGSDPISGAPRFTGGWFYLADGIQFAPLMAGVLALPEIILALWASSEYLKSSSNNWSQIKQGWHDFYENKWLSFRSGLIGGIVVCYLASAALLLNG